MNIDTELNLAEAAPQFNEPLSKLIQWGAHGKLTISVVANGWPVRSENEATDTVSGLVSLVPDDLLQSYGADFVRVRHVVPRNENETVTLVEPVEVRLGILYLTEEEFRRFRDSYGALLNNGDRIPLHLDTSHTWKSSLLITAIEAWTDLFADGDFDPNGKSPKKRIQEWLAKNAGHLHPTTRDDIAKLVNPDQSKGGGTPKTPGK